MDHYQNSDAESISVADFLRSPKAAPVKLCGRVLNFSEDKQVLELAWSGQSLAVRSPVRLSGFSRGDIVQVDLKSFIRDGSEWLAQEMDVQVLVPQLREPRMGRLSQELVPKWNHFLRLTREHFSGLGFTEIPTPTLVPCPGLEPTLEPFSTQWRVGRSERQLFLPTSPELSLKRALCEDWQRIFEIRRVFRNEELGELHLPEFTMLEWYEAFCPLGGVKKRLQAWIENLVREFGGAPWVWDSLSLKELFAWHLGFELSPESSREDLAHLASSHGLRVEESYDFDDLFHLLFVEKIEPKLPQTQALILHSYPPSQAALARLDSEGWAERFELYLNGIEIANAFDELNDPEEQRRRFHRDLELRNLSGRMEVPLDEEFLQDLERGMPPSSGIAVGLDRLFMVLMGLRHLPRFYVSSSSR